MRDLPCLTLPSAKGPQGTYPVLLLLCLSPEGVRFPFGGTHFSGVGFPHLLAGPGGRLGSGYFTLPPPSPRLPPPFQRLPPDFLSTPCHQPHLSHCHRHERGVHCFSGVGFPHLLTGPEGRLGSGCFTLPSPSRRVPRSYGRNRPVSGGQDVWPRLCLPETTTAAAKKKKEEEEEEK